MCRALASMTSEKTRYAAVTDLNADRGFLTEKSVRNAGVLTMLSRRDVLRFVLTHLREKANAVPEYFTIPDGIGTAVLSSSAHT